MKADMESLSQLGSEQLQAKLQNVQELDNQIFLLQNEDQSLYQRLKEQEEAIQLNLNNKRVVSWLEREMRLKLYDEGKRAKYIASLKQQEQATLEPFSQAVNRFAKEVRSPNKRESSSLTSSLSKVTRRNQVGQATFVSAGGVDDQSQGSSRVRVRNMLPNSNTPVDSEHTQRSARASFQRSPKSVRKGGGLPSSQSRNTPLRRDAS